MTDIIAQAKRKRDRKRKIRNIKSKLLRYLVGYPLHYIIGMPLIELGKLKDWYYSRRFSVIERKAIEEMKQYLLNELAADGVCFLSDEYDSDESYMFCVNYFIYDGTFAYRTKGRKYSMLYGKLFKDKAKENQLLYMNDLVIWLLDLGLEVTVGHYWTYYGNRKERLKVKNKT